MKPFMIWQVVSFRCHCNLGWPHSGTMTPNMHPLNMLLDPSSEEDSPRKFLPYSWSPTPTSLHPLHHGIKEALDPVWPEGRAWPPYFGLWILDLEQAYLLEGAFVSVWGDSLQIFLFLPSLRRQPCSALLSAARCTDKPAAEIPSGRGLLPSEGRKVVLCLPGLDPHRFGGTCPRGPLERRMRSDSRPEDRLWVVPLQCSKCFLFSCSEGAEPSHPLAILICLLGECHWLPWPRLLGNTLSYVRDIIMNYTMHYT
jgi:hypothetical protein